MAGSLIKRHVKAVLGTKAIRALKNVGELAAKQGGESTIENYKMLGKRAIVVAGVAVVALQVATFAIGTAISRKSEEQRIERVVHRVLEEERQKQEAAQQPERKLKLS